MRLISLDRAGSLARSIFSPFCFYFSRSLALKARDDGKLDYADELTTLASEAFDQANEIDLRSSAIFLPPASEAPQQAPNNSSNRINQRSRGRRRNTRRPDCGSEGQCQKFLALSGTGRNSLKDWHLHRRCGTQRGDVK
jgi:hypothetical protein